MLRVALWLLSAVLMLGAALSWSSGVRGVGPVAFGALILAFALLFERWQYRRRPRPSLARDWQDNGERFVDPGSGRRLKVQYNTATGERRYVDDATGRDDPGAGAIG